MQKWFFVFVILMFSALDASACGSRGSCYTGCSGYGTSMGRQGRGGQGPIDIGVYPGHSFGMQPPYGKQPLVIPGQQITPLRLPDPPQVVRQKAFDNLKGMTLFNEANVYKTRVLARLQAAMTANENMRARGITPYSPLIWNSILQERYYLDKGAPIYQVLNDIAAAKGADQTKLANEKRQDLAKVLMKLELLDVLATFGEELANKMEKPTDEVGRINTMIRALNVAGERVRADYSTEATLLTKNPSTVFVNAKRDYVNALPDPTDSRVRAFSQMLRSGSTATIANQIQAFARGQLNTPPAVPVPTSVTALARR